MIVNGLAALKGKRGVVLGIANRDSIAFGCAKVMRELGAEVAVSFLNEKAEPFVRPLADELGSPIVSRCDVERPGDLEHLFGVVAERWGGLDFLVHSIAFAPKEALQTRLVDCPADGFARAMDVSVHSLIRATRLAEPLMNQGGCVLTVSYHGAHEVIPSYGVMGPVKAALEAVVRYLAVELGDKGIRVHAVSPGPIKTRAASGIPQFEALIHSAEGKSPLRHLASIEDVGRMAAMLVSDDARALTGNIIYVDAGVNIVG